MATTQYQPHGLPGGRYSSFAGKAASTDGPHNPGTITQHSPLGMWMMRYGSFAGKEAEGGVLAAHRIPNLHIIHHRQKRR